MATLIAEDFVLLALDLDGTPARMGIHDGVEVGVAGALLAEVADHGRLELEDGRIRMVDGPPLDHPLLEAARAAAGEHEGKRLRSRLPKIQKAAGWKAVVDSMIDAGVLGREKETLRATRHPVLDPARHAELLDRVRAAAAGDGPLDTPTGVLLALAGPCQMLEVVAPERSERGHAKKRIAEAAASVPAAAAVKYVIEAAAAAAVIAATAASASGGSG